MTFSIKMRYAAARGAVFNSTLITQNTTDVLTVCTDSLENFYFYFLWKGEQFPTWSDFALGFLQNLLANVMRLTAINNEF